MTENQSSAVIVGEPNLTSEIKRIAFEIEDGTRRLINGRQFRVPRDNPVVEGRYILPPGYDLTKQWYLDDSDTPQEYQRPLTRAELVVIERMRIDAGLEAKAEIAVAMKGDGATLDMLSEEQFEALNAAATPVSQALSDGQFQTAWKRWVGIFANPTTADASAAAIITAFISTPAYADLRSEVANVIKDRLKRFDKMTDAEADSFIQNPS